MLVELSNGSLVNINMIVGLKERANGYWCVRLVGETWDQGELISSDDKDKIVARMRWAKTEADYCRTQWSLTRAM